MTTAPTPASSGRRRRRVPALALLVPLGLAATAACSSSTTTDTTATTKAAASPGAGSTKGTEPKPKGVVAQISLPKLTVTATEDGEKYLFDAPATVKTGWTDLTLDNTKGKLNHQLNVARIKEGVTKEQVEGMLNGPAPESALALVDAFIGGPNNVVKGTSVNSIVNFDKPGDYVMLCFMQDAPDFKFHIQHGMFRWITAEQGSTTGSAAQEEPRYDSTIEMKDFEWLLPDRLSGQGWVELTNSGEQPHELAIYTLAPGKTLEDAKAFIATPPPAAPDAGAGATTTTMAATGTTMGMTGTTKAESMDMGGAPWKEVGGFGAVSPKQVAYMKLDLKPGTYLFVCFIPDAGPPPAHDFKPHALHGMIKEVTVS